MNAGTTWLVCKPVPLVRAFFLLLLAATLAGAAVAQDSTFGTLVVQSPVQAVATINGEGAFLLVPGQDLRWSRIRPGSYRVDVRSGGQQWQQQVQVQPGRTETLVAALSAAGNPLEAGVPPPPPVTGAAPTPAYVPPPPPAAAGPAHAPAYVPPPPPRAVPTVSTPSDTQPQQRKEDREAQQRREQDAILRRLASDREAQQPQREAEARARREEQQREQERLEAEEQNQPRRRRPKVH